MLFPRAARLIARWSDEYDQAVVSAFTKLADLLPQPIARHVAATMLAVGAHSSNDPFTRTFATVARAWSEGRVVEIDYEPSDGNRRSTRVRPYFLEPDAALRTVYLIGFDETAAALRTFKIERIRSATLMSDRYEIPDDFDRIATWRTPGASGPPKGHQPRRSGCGSMHPSRAGYARRSASLAATRGAARWRRGADVHGGGIVEIRRGVLVGDGVEVLSPPSLRDSVASAVSNAAARYRAATTLAVAEGAVAVGRSADPVETELKLSATGPAPLRRLAGSQRSATRHSGAPNTYLELDRYLDTDDGRLAAAKWACRLRSRSGRIASRSRATRQRRTSLAVRCTSGRRSKDSHRNSSIRTHGHRPPLATGCWSSLTGGPSASSSCSGSAGPSGR